MNKFEKLIEYIINDEDQKARELFHEIVVEKSRDIYESIMDEESMEETVAGNQVEDMVDEVGAEEAMGENDEEGEELELGADDEIAVDDEMGPADSGEEHDDVEEKVMSIDAKLDELLAKFDEIMGDEEPAGEEEFGGEEFGAEEPEMMETEEVAEEQVEEEVEEVAEAAEGSGNPFAKSGKSGKSGSGSAMSGKSGKSGSGKTESRVNKSTTELMREYVDRIGDIYGGAGDAAEGDAVGAAGKKTSVNDKSITGPGADFGGHTATPKGGVQNQDGTSPAAAPKAQDIKSGNRNVPGGKAGSPESTGKEYSKASDAEGQTTDGKVAVATKSVQKQNTGK